MTEKKNERNEGVIMSAVLNFITNQILLSAFVGYLVAQICKKILFEWKGINQEILKEDDGWMIWLRISGGMPSSHASMLTAAVVALGFAENVFVNIRQVINSAFCIAIVFMAMFLFDAFTSRQAIGENSKLLNKIAEILKWDHKILDKELKEVSGHTFAQVVVGSVIGISIGIGISFLVEGVF